MNEDERLVMILAYECEIFTLYPVGSSKHDPALAFQDAYNEAVARDKAAAAALLASV